MPLEAIVTLGNTFSVPVSGQLIGDGNWTIEAELQAADIGPAIVRRAVAAMTDEEMQINVEAVQDAGLEADPPGEVAEVEMLITRPWESNVQAFVKAKVKQELEAESLLQALIRAVTAWVRTSEAGQQAWKHSSQDFNTADLMNHLGNQELWRCLEAEGIWDLEIQPLKAAQEWLHDTILVDELELEARPGGA